MVIPPPKKGEKEQHYISRTIKWLKKHEGNKYFPKQRVAIAYEKWREIHPE